MGTQRRPVSWTLIVNLCPPFVDRFCLQMSIVLEGPTFGPSCYDVTTRGAAQSRIIAKASCESGVAPQLSNKALGCVLFDWGAYSC